MPVSMFQLRTLLDVVIEQPRAKSFLRDTFFPTVRTFNTDQVDIDMVDEERRRSAPFVHPRSGGSFVYRDAYTTKTFEPAYVAPKIPTVAEDIMRRAPGETLYARRSPEQRAAAIIAENLQTLDRMITRTEELMASEALFTGKVTIKGTAVDQVLQFWPSAEADQPKSTAAIKWDQTGADPLGDLEDCVELMGKRSGLTPRRAILGSRVARALIANLTTNGILDNRRIDVGTIQPSIVAPGVRYLGTLRFPQLELYTYSEWIEDPATSELAQVVPENKVLIASDGARTTRAYGMVHIIDENGREQFIESDRVPNSWVQREQPAGRVVQMSSRPLMILNQVYGFHVLDALDATASTDESASA